eukprot:222838-Prorocentrum_minimum.AAC.1
MGEIITAPWVKSPRNCRELNFRVTRWLDKVAAYAEYLGIDIEADSDMLYIAEMAMSAPLPQVRVC